MGNSVSRVVGCFVPVAAHDRDRVAVFFSEPLDEGLGHSFCYVRPDSPHLSPSHSERYNTLTGLHHDADYHSSSFRSGNTETAAFKAISGASVSANTSTPRTIVCHEQFHSFNVPDDRHAAFESTPSFTSIPLQPVPRGVSFSGPVSGTFSAPMSGSALQDRGFMTGLDEHQPRGFMSGPLERAFTSGPLERGFMSGPLERSSMSGPIENSGADRTHFSAPLAGAYHFRRNRRTSKISRFLSSVRKPVKGALNRTISTTLARTRRSLVAPVRQFVWRHLHSGTKESTIIYDTPSELRYASSDSDPTVNQKLQWAQGKAGEDRVHVVISEEHGWLFVGIYDGFYGPDAPDFLMRNLYRAVYKELQGLLWDVKECPSETKLEDENEPPHDGNVHSSHNGLPSLDIGAHGCEAGGGKLMFAGVSGSESGRIRVNKDGVLVRSRTLKELLESDNFISGADESQGCMSSHLNLQTEGTNAGCANVQSERLSCNHYTDERSSTNSEAESVSIQSSSKNGNCTEEAPGQVKKHSTNMETSNQRQERVSTTWIQNFRHRQIKNKESHRKFLPQRCDSLTEMKESVKESNQGEPKLWKQGVVDHAAVLRALARALETTEQAYLDMADQALEENPELALMGSCILVALMKEKDVYILNVGDSRAIVAQERKNEYPLQSLSSTDSTKRCCGKDIMNRPDLERISEESAATEVSGITTLPPPPLSNTLYALQLSTDHSTSIEEEVSRIKAEHPDDDMCILNDRVKGRLKVTRAFGAGFLKKPRWNSAILKMFQIDYIGTAPYVACTPALHHHRLGPDDRFLILSSDGLYQYFSNQEVVSQVEWFMEKFPEGDPAQHLIEELLFRAAKKAGMDFHDLLDIPQGDRRKYHDDVSVMVISIDGRIWRSSG